jgi:F420-0:gamma-glutamyl ligase
MGEASERLPVVIVRDMNVKLTEEPKRSPKIAPKRCIYFSALKPPKKR